MPPQYRYVENEGALFRIVGPSNAFPDEVWSPNERKFVPYQGDVPKPVSWGQEMGEDEVREFIGEEAMRQSINWTPAR